jgi:hypothetical protein
MLVTRKPYVGLGSTSAAPHTVAVIESFTVPLMVLLTKLLPGDAVTSSSVTTAPSARTGGVCVCEGVPEFEAVLVRVCVTEPVLVTEGVPVPVGDAPPEIEGVGVAVAEGVGSATPARKKPTPKALPGVEATLHAPPPFVVLATAKKVRKLFCVVLADGA